MESNAFWSLIDRAATKSKGDAEEFVALLAESLGECSPKDVIGFQVELERVLSQAYRWDLWGAAYVIMGGCSDDGFEYFRAWLVSRGKKTFDAALANPDSLASLNLEDPEACECEVLLWLAAEVYSDLTDGEDLYEKLPPSKGGEAGPSGTAWDEEELPELFPKLSKKYLDE